MAYVPEVRASLPSDIWRPLFPMSAMPWVAICLAEQEHGATRHASRRQDREPAARLVEGYHHAKWEFPPKPSRMRWRTYRRLKQQYEELRGRWMAGVMGRFGVKA